MKKHNLVAPLLLLSVTLITSPAVADDLGGYDYSPYYRDGVGSAGQGWYALTERQKYLDRAIRAVLENINQTSISVTDQNVAWMMGQIGAQSYEANFVAQRMQLYVDYSQTIENTDNTLCAIGRQFGISAGTAWCR